jgi:hypothetical protein
MQPKTRYTMLFSLLLLVPALWYSFTADQPTPNQYFSYNFLQPENTFVQVTRGQSQVVPFAFAVDATVSEIRLELEDIVLQQKGVTLEDSIVSVTNGKAASRAVFGFPAQGVIKPGTYYLNILARDTTSGKIIHTGEIPFIVDMEEIIAGCSC